jgi:hypothetical protein
MLAFLGVGDSHIPYSAVIVATHKVTFCNTLLFSDHGTSSIRACEVQDVTSGNQVNGMCATLPVEVLQLNDFKSSSRGRIRKSRAPIVLLGCYIHNAVTNTSSTSMRYCDPYRL